MDSTALRNIVATLARIRALTPGARYGSQFDALREECLRIERSAGTAPDLRPYTGLAIRLANKVEALRWAETPEEESALRVAIVASARPYIR